MRNRYMVQRVQSGVLAGSVQSGEEDTHSASGEDESETEAEILAAMEEKSSATIEAEILAAMEDCEEVLERSFSKKRITKEQIEELKENFREMEKVLINELKEIESKYEEEMKNLKEKITELEGEKLVLDLKNELLELSKEDTKLSKRDAMQVEEILSRLDEVSNNEKKLMNQVFSLTEIAKEQKNYIHSLRNEIIRLGGTPLDSDIYGVELLGRDLQEQRERHRQKHQDEDVPKVIAKEHQRLRGQDKDVPTVTARVVREQRARQRQQRE